MTIDYFAVISVVSIGIVSALIFLVLFEPGLDYRIGTPLPASASDEFESLLCAVIDESPTVVTHWEVHTRGADFYEAELRAIAAARTSIHIEAFIFHEGPIGKRFINALSERAAAGVTVRIIVDAFGSILTPSRFFAPLREAGGQVVWYQPLRWYTLKRYNNRTHRELLIVDGTTGFIGGAGIAGHWNETQDGLPPWRDTVVKVEGPAVVALQTVFIDNWLEGSGEILAAEEVFPQDNRVPHPRDHHGIALALGSNPTAGRSTRSRTLFQLLIAAAGQEVLINSPYFLPDRALRRCLLAAAARGVEIRVIMPGTHNNHLFARLASRRLYGELLRGGIRLFEYQPGMIHAKIMVVDRIWSVVGSTNFDSRSFELNDEVNLAVRDPALAARLGDDFQLDLSRSPEVKLAEWEKRPLAERIGSMIGRVIERQE
ncbi:phospholipase D-like domain-containing protein [Noviherbaspirillum galbum]|uniref:Cardiolipin synthase B n=1 Tax=Noviherbaspirillum galbum TaxID=2709383 RepID=A0A6B3SZX4_9BURK|nr:phospholipase D-like domain-containing protein [Noviherbaspirillum galbum]NEX64859.1 cardiolipin synthase B [Noviherbaspirillum galbum]